MPTEQVPVEIERQRAARGGFTEVIVSRADDGEERLYVGEINGTSMLRHQSAEDGDNAQQKRYFIIERVRLPYQMNLDELMEWLKNGPDRMADVMKSDVPECFGSTVGLTEFYPGETDTGCEAVGGH